MDSQIPKLLPVPLNQNLLFQEVAYFLYIRHTIQLYHPVWQKFLLFDHYKHYLNFLELHHKLDMLLIIIAQSVESVHY